MATISSPLSLAKTNKYSSFSLSSKTRKTPIASLLSIGLQDIVDLAHNKVLVAATVSATVGQLSKPFTSAIRGDGFNFKSLVQSGGMPSTHSASVVAAATSLALERGFSDSIFGMSVVFAALVMYDAQGVRREVGKHAKILNAILKAQEMNTSYMDEATSVKSKENLPRAISQKQISESYSIPSLRIDDKEKLDILNNYKPLNESVGHTEFQIDATEKAIETMNETLYDSGEDDVNVLREMIVKVKGILVHALTDCGRSSYIKRKEEIRSKKRNEPGSSKTKEALASKQGMKKNAGKKK